MLVVVPGAFRGAGVADFRAERAERAELRVEFRAAAHEGGGEPASVGAINAETRALRHLAEASVSAMFAFLRAAHAGVDTALVFLMCHFIFLLL